MKTANLIGKVIRSQITTAENNIQDMTGMAKGVYLLKIVKSRIEYD